MQNRCFVTLLFLMLTVSRSIGAEAKLIRLESGDGLGLLFEDGGDVKAVTLYGKLLNSEGVQGGFLIFDFLMGKRWSYFPTKARREGADVILTGEDDNTKFKVQAIWSSDTQRKCLTFKANIKDLTGKDRCAIIAYQLPVNLVGWKWCDDIEDSVLIEPNKTHSKVWYVGNYSIYPWCAVTHKQIGGLSLAVPMHPPRPFRLVAGAEKGLGAEFDFGFIADNKSFPSCADFQLVLYTHDSAWGFRSAAKRYYQLFPEYFNVRVKRQGLWYCFHEPFGKLENPQDFGFAFDEVPLPQTGRTKEFVEADRKFQCYTFTYTEPWGWWSWAIGLQNRFKLQPQVPYEEAVAYVHELAANKEKALQGGVYNHAIVAQTILNSGIYDRNGRLYVSHYSPYYGYMWHINPSPYAVPEGKVGRFQVTYEWEIEPSLKMGASGIYLDSIIGTWTGAENYRREQLATTVHPLTFNRDVLKPIQLGVWNNYEFVEHLANDLHRRGKLLMANIFPYNWVFFNHQLDVIGHEIFGVKTTEEIRADPGGARIFMLGPGHGHPAMMRAGRTLAYQKPYCWLWAGPVMTSESGERWMRETMMYGIFFTIGTEERNRSLYRRYMPITVAMAEAGWEPVTYAQVKGEGGENVQVERFGPKGGNLFFSLRNNGTKVATIRLVIDSKALEIPVPKEAMRLPEGDMLVVCKDGSVELDLPPAMVTVVRVR